MVILALATIAVIALQDSDEPVAGAPAAQPVTTFPAPPGPPERFLPDAIEGDAELVAILRDFAPDSIADRWRAGDVWRRDFRYNRQRLELSLIRVPDDATPERWRIADEARDIDRPRPLPKTEALARFGR